MSFGLIWPHFVGGHGESAYRPEGHAVLGGGLNFPFLEGTQMHRGNTGST